MTPGQAQRMVTIYGVKSLELGDLVYVGQTQSLPLRKYGHRKSGPLKDWLPNNEHEFIVLAVVPHALGAATEQAQMDAARARGCRLFNKIPAGETHGRRDPNGKKLTVELTPEELEALRGEASRQRISIASLIRRFALGMCGALSLLACGGGDFSSPGPHSDAGSGAMAAGSGAMAGAGGNTNGGAGKGGAPTSEAGAANDPAVWSGKTYFLSVPANSWTSPPHVGSVLGGVAPALLLSIEGSGDSLTTTISTSAGSTTAESASQDMCTPTSYAALDASNYPKSEIGPLDVRAHLVSGNDSGATQVMATLYGLHLTNVLPGDDSASGSLETTVDMRQLYVLFPALGATRTPDSVCNSFAVNYTTPDCSTADCMQSCQPCPSDGKPYCLTLKASNVSAVVSPAAVVDLEGSARSRSCADSKP